MINNYCTFVMLTIFSICFCSNSFANSIDQLIATKQLKISIKRQSEGTIIAKQAVTLHVEILTNRWFSGGNIIEDIKLENVISLPQSDSGINGSMLIDGETWASQIKEITIYPMTAGLYQIPPLQVTMSINTESGEITGTTTTAPLSFEVYLPEQLSIYSQYWVSKSFAIATELNYADQNSETKEDNINEFSTEKSDVLQFEIGQAVTQTITFTIDDIPAMMLPELTTPQISGVSIYHKPGQVFDKSNRGSLIGTRIEEFTYIFEKPGNYTMDEKVFVWWDINNQTLQELVIEAQQWHVTAPFSYHIKNLLVSPKNWLSIKGISYFLGLLIAIYLIKFLYQSRMIIIEYFKRLSKYQLRQQSKTFLQLVKAQQYQQACFCLYNLLDLKDTDLSTLQAFFANHKIALELVNELFTTAFKTDSKPPTSTFTVLKAKKLLKIIRQFDKDKYSSTISMPSLNPR